MMLDVHPLHPSRPFPNRKPNRENRIKNACKSNSHSNIALSNDKRPLFVQILAIPSASLVSTSLPIQCLRPTNFFFYRGIFPNSFLCDRILMTHELFYLSRDQILMTHEVLKLSSDRILMRSQHKRLVYEMHSEKGKPPPCSLEAERGHSWQTVCGRTHRPTLRSCLEFISEDIQRIFPGILFHLLRSIASYVTKKMGQKGGNRPG